MILVNVMILRSGLPIFRLLCKCLESFFFLLQEIITYLRENIYINGLIFVYVKINISLLKNILNYRIEICEI